MSPKTSFIIKTVALCIVALLIPTMLVVDAVQARKYVDLREQVLELEDRQAQIIEENKKLITDISILSSADRIETIAQDSLDMRKAETDEIIRVEIKDARK